ncbi:transmembrane and coiled-coil domains-containing protein 7 [Schistosoma haematobium]|uniref:Transmembrane and coiled-coil domains-containing protein 7 n=1 Tax=Schistosoma haematobium TaxID=6185 RepID=A0A094ZWT6_SCHHA|nr:transmembrane and coiled-coil domains-containing protein 7 [Schistosoma haematobium]KAH9592081.1 transmembrane and coiled-coil domains-containing protein 7 [Schistosoma haematobium]
MDKLRLLFSQLTSLLPSSDFSDPDPCIRLREGVEAYVQKSNDENLLFDLNGTEVHEAFYLCCLNFLHACNDLYESNAANDSADIPIFSVFQEKKLSSCLQFVVAYGVYPLLETGVSLPLSMRLENYEKFICPRKEKDEERIEKLMKIIKCLLSLRQSKSFQLQRLVSTTSFLGDLIASLFQSAFGMDSYLRSNDFTSERVSSLMAYIRESRKILWKLLLELPRHIAMKELMILQGGTQIRVKGAVQLPKAPIWLRKSCGRLLSRLLVHPVVINNTNVEKSGNAHNLGVRSLLLASLSLCPGILPSTGPITSIDPRIQPKMISTLANILTTIPEFLHNSSDDLTSRSSYEKYFSLVSVQLLEIINAKINTTPNTQTDSLAVAHFFYNVAIKSVHDLCQKSSEINGNDDNIGKKLLLWPLIGLLRKFCQISSVVSEKELVKDNSLAFDFTTKCQLASHHDLARLLEIIKDLLDCPEPSQIVITELCKLSRPLFILFAQTIEDEDNVNDSESFTSLKECLIWILNRLLSSDLNSRFNRLSLIRSWFNLPAPSLKFMPSELQHDVSIMSSTTDWLSAYSCQENLMFRLLSKVQPMESSSTSLDEITMRKHNSVYVPYTCVIINEKLPTVNGIQNFSSSIKSLVTLLFFMSPSSFQNNSSNKQVGHHLHILIDEKQSEKNQINEITTHADLFLSLLTDLHYTFQAIFESMNEALIPQNEKDIIEIGTVSSLITSAMIESLDDLIWPQDINQACNLFEALFHRFCCLLQHAENHEHVEFLYQMLSQLLGILAFYANKLGSTRDNEIITARDEFSRLLPILNKLELVINSISHSMGNSTLNLLKCIKVTLATRGAIPCHDSFSTTSVNNLYFTKCNFDKAKAETHQSECPQKIIEEVTISNPQNVQQSVCSQLEDPTLKKIFEELHDPLIPVQGHALIVLSRLLESRDSCIWGHEKLIFEVLTKYLSHTDSYIYLNAIRCLSAMGCMLTDKVLNLLLNQFTKCMQTTNKPANPIGTTVTSTAGDYDIEYKLKLAESIMRVLSNLGEMAPKYRTEVFNSFVMGSKSSEELIRAACLSNIAELVRLLKYSVQPIIYEILLLIEFHLSQDVSNVVRKASAYLARSLFLPETSTTELPPWIPCDVIRDLHRLLSTRRIIEKDTSVQEQIESALAQIDLCTRNTVFLKPDSSSNLVKQIHILNP